MASIITISKKKWEKYPVKSKSMAYMESGPKMIPAKIHGYGLHNIQWM